jgi:hypothetical protein
MVFDIRRARHPESIEGFGRELSRTGLASYQAGFFASLRMTREVLQRN